MISRLRGTLLEINPPDLLIEVAGGIAYDVEIPSTAFESLSECGQEITLYTHLVVREDAHSLYGFMTPTERGLFRLLIKASGVGPKLAMVILSWFKPTEFVQCIQARDSKRLTQVPGIGKKTGERLIIEMRDRVSRLSIPALDLNLSAEQAHLPQSIPAREEAISALLSLGYRLDEANRAVSRVEQKDLSSEALIREALKQKSVVRNQ